MIARVETKWLAYENLQVSCKGWLTSKNFEVEWLIYKNLEVTANL